LRTKTQAPPGAFFFGLAWLECRRGSQRVPPVVPT